MQMPTITPDDFRMTMALFPGAVTLITTGTGENRRGLTATAVCSVSDAPPSLLVCVNRNAETCAAISRQGAFSIQLLGEADQPLALRFAGAKGVRGDAKFASGDWDSFACGLPRLQTARASIACTVTSETDSGSHRIFIGRITDVSRMPDHGALVYAQSAFHGLSPAR